MDESTKKIYTKMFEEAREAYTKQKEILAKYKEDCAMSVYAINNSMLNSVGAQMHGIANYISPKKPSTVYTNELRKNQKGTNHCYSCEYFHKDADKFYGVCHNEKMSIAYTGYISNEKYRFDDNEHKWQKRSPDQTCCKNYKQKEEVA